MKGILRLALGAGLAVTGLSASSSWTHRPIDRRSGSLPAESAESSSGDSAPVGGVAALAVGGFGLLARFRRRSL